MFCDQDCCIGAPIQRYAAQRVLDPELIEEVHMFSNGHVELDYVHKPDALPENDLFTDPRFGYGLVHVFHSMGAALTWFTTNKGELNPWKPRREFIKAQEREWGLD